MGTLNNGSDGTNYLAKIIRETIATAMSGVNVSFIAEVVKVSPPTVSVQPLALTPGSNNKQGIIEKALVLTDGNDKVKLKSGDHVICGVLDHDTTHYNRKKFFRQMTSTPHLVNNAVVLGKVAGKEDF